jgi:hypothetical protein
MFKKNPCPNDATQMHRSNEKEEIIAEFLLVMQPCPVGHTKVPTE